MAIPDRCIADRVILNAAIGTIVLLMGLSICMIGPQSAGADERRFYYMGDGQIHLTSEKNHKTFRGRFRRGLGGYDAAALRQISRVFGAPYAPARMALSLRLLEFLDFLEDRHRQGAQITITSGYRNPKYNTKLRKQGRLAAKASLHQYGMAVDMIMQGVPAKRIWEDVKALGFGGTGYYQGKTVHIDVGPARSWDQSSSGVGTGISDDNKLIGLIGDYDYYRPGQQIALRFIRMTAFPIGVDAAFSIASVIQPDKPSLNFTPIFSVDTTNGCPTFERIDQMAGIDWQLPDHLPSGRYVIRARFCNNDYPDMPEEVVTPEIEIVK